MEVFSMKTVYRTLLSALIMGTLLPYGVQAQADSSLSALSYYREYGVSLLLQPWYKAKEYAQARINPQYIQKAHTVGKKTQELADTYGPAIKKGVRSSAYYSWITLKALAYATKVTLQTSYHVAKFLAINFDTLVTKLEKGSVPRAQAKPATANDSAIPVPPPLPVKNSAVIPAQAQKQNNEVQPGRSALLAAIQNPDNIKQLKKVGQGNNSTESTAESKDVLQTLQKAFVQRKQVMNGSADEIAGEPEESSEEDWE
jgi:hypothetical protein